MAHSRFIAAAIVIASIGHSALSAAPSDTVAAETGSSVHSRYLVELAKVKAAGIPTTLSEVFPTSPPADQNAFPIYVKIGDDHSFPAGADEKRLLPLLKPGASDADWNDAHIFLQKHADLVAAVHEAASKPLCVAPGRADTKDPSAILLPELTPIRRAARILSVESQVLAHDGKAHDAIKNAELGFRMSDHACQNPTLMGWLVGIASDAITINSIESIMLLNRHQPNIVAEANEMLESHRHAHGIVNAFKGEAGFGLSELTFIRSNSFAGLKDLSSDGSVDSSLTKKTPAEWNDFIDANGIQMMKHYRAIIAAAADPYPVSSAKIERDIADLDAQRGEDTYIAHILFPAFPKIVSKQAMIDARVAIVQASAALYIWRAKHGEYPATLQEAAGKVAVDPFDLKPIRYRQDGTGFMLYSVGDTGKYDGGAHKEYEMVLRVSGDGVAKWE